jgi:uncharacterized protein YaaR (DUF327 family)
MRVNLSTDFTIPLDIISKKQTKDTLFDENLSKSYEIMKREQLDNELIAITKQGRKVCESLTLSDLKKYKEMVTNFLRICISGGLSYKEEEMTTRYGKTKILSTVKLINKKLMDLAETLVSQNQNALEIAAIVDEIRGLLMDLYI